MNLFKFVKYLLGVAMLLFAKLSGLLLLLGGAVSLGGLVLVVIRLQQHKSVLPMLICICGAAALLFSAAAQVPPLRIIDLLYF